MAAGNDWWQKAVHSRQARNALVIADYEEGYDRCLQP
jgi:hypothetical protein